MNHLYRNPNDFLIAADFPNAIGNVMPPDANKGVEEDCDECEGEGVFECSECGHETECDECDGSGVVDAHPDDVKWEQLNDLSDVTILNQFGCQVTKPAWQWAESFTSPSFVGMCFHYPGE